MSGAGNFTPDSMIWRITREWAVMIGGGRALLMQACHPLALAGVMEHSNYAEGVWGRLERTMYAGWTAGYGTPEEAERGGRVVRGMHTKGNGTLDRSEEH